MLIKVPRGWELPERLATPESVYWNRREVLRALGLTGSAAWIGGCGLSVHGVDVGDVGDWTSPYEGWFPVPRNEAYEVLERPLTEYLAATRYNNYYEFTVRKDAVWQLVGNFQVEPWTIELAGLCRNPGLYDLEDWLGRFSLQERIYRHRCVERWAMTVPWSGFPLSEVVAFADPLPEARYVAFVSENRPDEMPGVDAAPQYPWPYFEALTLAEATNELAFLVSGMYGRATTRQNGSPLRLAVPWKYGYKSTKAIIRITFTDAQPPTFWNTINPAEYSFESNVDPDVPHPRWSQEFEWLLPDRDDRVPTVKYNHYGEFVAGLYA